MAVPLAQLALAAVSLSVTALAAGSWVQLVPGALLALNCYAYWTLARGDTGWSSGWPRPGMDPMVGVVALALVLPAVMFAVDMVMGYREGRSPRDDDTWGIDHWPTQAALGLATAAVAVAVAVGVRGRWTGTAVSGGCVAVAAGWFGYWSTVYPDHAGSAGEAGGMALIAWACAFIGVVGWRLGTRRADHRHDGT
jgi:hypothetical protein